MTSVLDPEAAHLAALHRLGDFRRQRILELVPEERLLASETLALVEKQSPGFVAGDRPARDCARRRSWS
jgi:hypothetical protein